MLTTIVIIIIGLTGLKESAIGWKICKTVNTNYL